MSYSFSTYHFYGAYVPSTQYEGLAAPEGDRLEMVIRSTGLGDKSARVSHVTAGDYDRDLLFLCIRVEGVDPEVELGEFRLSPHLPVLSEWDRALRLAATAADYDTSKLIFGWITVPDYS